MTTTTQIPTIESLVAIGGSEWKAGDKHRVYFNRVCELAGLDVSYYGSSGRVSGGRYKGEALSNKKLDSLSHHFGRCKIWFDAVEGKYAGQGFDDGEFADVVAAIRAKLV